MIDNLTTARRRCAPWSRGAISLLLLLLGNPGLSRICHADEAKSVVQFNEFNRSGTEAYEKQDFETAIKNFQQAYAIKPEPLLFYNIAQCYRKINHDADAIIFYQSYLRRPESTDPELRAKAEGFLADLRGRHVGQPQLMLVETAHEPRPIWRIGLGIGLFATSTVLLGFGGRALDLDGRCADSPSGGGGLLKCTNVADTKGIGIGLVTAGSLIAIGGIVSIALPGRRHQVTRSTDPTQETRPQGVKPMAAVFPAMQPAMDVSSLQASSAF